MDQIVIADTLNGLGQGELQDYLAHAYCLDGTCTIKYNGNDLLYKKGDVLILRKGKLVEKIAPADDFRVKVIYVTPNFVTLSTPQSNYGVKGQLSLFLNPVMHLTQEQQMRCMQDFEEVELRLNNKNHHFYQEMMINVIQAMILDFFDFHSHLYGEINISDANASVMVRFLNMLENGEFREHRELAYYADRLCVTPKYLSEVTKKVSGCAANYWINSYTARDISRLLKDKTLTFVQISDMFGFSSPAYFSRYVQNNLGVSPTEFRGYD